MGAEVVGSEKASAGMRTGRMNQPMYRMEFLLLHRDGRYGVVSGIGPENGLINWAINVLLDESIIWLLDVLMRNKREYGDGFID